MLNQLNHTGPLLWDGEKGQKRALEASQGVQKEALERLEEKLGMLGRGNAQLLKHFAQVRGEDTHTVSVYTHYPAHTVSVYTLHTLLVCTQP